jgi:hypothetical protein
LCVGLIIDAGNVFISTVMGVFISTPQHKVCCLLEQPEWAELLAPLNCTHCTEKFISTSLARNGAELRRFLDVAGASSGTIWGATAVAIAAPGGAMTAEVSIQK